MTVLVTGGAGYIGCHTVRALSSLGREVVVLDTLETGYEAALLGAPLVVGDVADMELVRKVVKDHRVDSVIHFAGFKKAKALIFGISADSVESHEKFKKKMGFPFDLLSDPDNTVCKLYDVIQEKSMYGKKYMGIERSTFLIDAKGVLRQEWRKVKVKGHAEAVLAAVKAL